MDPKAAISHLLADNTLKETEAHTLFESILQGQADAAQIAAILALIQRRAATVDEIVGAALAIRAHVQPVPLDQARLPHGSVLLDTCGTGGAAKTFNVSTTAALVVAAAAKGRVFVAKHGNRSRTGRGSAEVLEALGVNVNVDPAGQARCLLETGICFCFAIHHHPAMRHASVPRASLGHPTLFNILGPLTNPARATHQLIGVYRPELVAPVAAALARLGSTRAMIAHSRDGMDELSPVAHSDFALVSDGKVTHATLDPEAHGIPATSPESLRVGDLESAVAVLLAVLNGTPGGPRNAVVLNAGAALWVASVAENLDQGIRLASDTIDSGRALATLDDLIKASKRS